MTIETKRCAACRKIKPVNCFYLRRKGKKILECYCKSCEPVLRRAQKNFDVEGCADPIEARALARGALRDDPARAATMFRRPPIINARRVREIIRRYHSGMRPGEISTTSGIPETTVRRAVWHAKGRKIYASEVLSK